MRCVDGPRVALDERESADSIPARCSCTVCPVTTISFAKDGKALIKGAKEVLVIGPAKVLAGGPPSKLLDKRRADMLRELVKDTKPGDRGAVASTLGGTIGWLKAGVLPDEVSRYNCPARADAIRHVVDSAGVASRGKTGIVLVLDDASHLLAAVNAVGRALPEASYKSKSSSGRVQLLAVLADGTIVEPSDVVTSTLEFARDSARLVDTPPSELNPDGFAKEAKAMLEELGVKVTEIAGDKLLEHGLGGIHGVGRGASSKPRMLVATYEPAEPAAGKKQHIALVGKGVTFDTGGLHIKARGSMEGMKADMGGAAAVLGAFRVLVASGTPHQVTLILCMAENAVSSESYKPDDVLTLHSGKTVEINNTDAEGRLLLGDGVSWAARELKATTVINAATLTGAQLIATGLVHAAVVSNDEELEAAAVAAGKRSGDLVHPLPFAPELYHGEFRSPLADMRNSVANRMNAQSSCAAQFVYNHLEDAPGAARRRWCHIDLAGPAFPKDRGTGYGVALISELVRSL